MDEGRGGGKRDGKLGPRNRNNEERPFRPPVASPATTHPHHQVYIYVDGAFVGEAVATADTPHQVVDRLCGAAAADKSGGGASHDAPTHPATSGVGFRVPLPPLSPGRHDVRAFVARPGAARSSAQEASQSPLPFLETAGHPAPAEALRRKDAIIRVRNAQVSALWDELHTRQPWRNALKTEGGGGGGANAAGGIPITLDAATTGADAANSSRLVAVIGVNTGISAFARRANLRATWVPTGAGLAALEKQHGVVIRFVVGYSDQKDDPDEKRLAAEAAQYGDVLRLDMVDTYADLSLKTLKMFSTLPTLWDADFYFKIDDDVAVNVPAMAAYLAARRGQGNLYLGCMKSGQVLTDRRYKWFEPEHWRFGDPATAEGAVNYMRHASGGFVCVGKGAVGGRRERRRRRKQTLTSPPLLLPSRPSLRPVRPHRPLHRARRPRPAQVCQRGRDAGCLVGGAGGETRGRTPPVLRLSGTVCRSNRALQRVPVLL